MKKKPGGVEEGRRWFQESRDRLPGAERRKGDDPGVAAEYDDGIARTSHGEYMEKDGKVEMSS